MTKKIQQHVIVSRESILRDFQDGMDIEEVSEKYGFKSPQTLCAWFYRHNHLKWIRGKGFLLPGKMNAPTKGVNGAKLQDIRVGSGRTKGAKDITRRKQTMTPKSGTVSLSVGEELVEKFDRLSRLENRSKRSLFAEMVEDYQTKLKERRQQIKEVEKQRMKPPAKKTIQRKRNPDNKPVPGQTTVLTACRKSGGGDRVGS